MEFINKTCPVCGLEFKDGDDIVVCPECGTPHHRSCYEQTGHCAFEDKHGEDFTQENTVEDAEKEENYIICPRCNAHNAKDMFYCGKCGYPIGINSEQNSQGNAQPFSPVFNMLDPMAGINPEEDMGDEVTAGELSKFVQKNTQYFIRVFYNLKQFMKGRFNFCAFLFTGGYLLYRKMYKIGAVISAIMGLLIIAEVYVQFSPAYQSFIDAVETFSKSSSGYIYVYQAFLSLSSSQQLFIGLMSLSSIVQLIIKIIIGFKANRWYFNHCRSEVKKIKSEEENPAQAIETRGGVNIAIAISLYFIYLAINYIPILLGYGI